MQDILLLTFSLVGLLGIMALLLLLAIFTFLIWRENGE